MRIFIVLLLLASTAHAVRYVGTTESVGGSAPSIVKGRWIGQDFRGRYKCRGTSAQCPSLRRGRVILRALPHEGIVGPPNGEAQGTITFGRGTRQLTCEFSGVLADSVPPAWTDPRESIVLRGAITCDATMYFSGTR